MSYENPTRAIDTQSAQHFANLQNSLVGSFMGVAKNYKADQAARTKKLNEQAVAIDKIKKTNQNIEDNLRNNMAKFGAQNPSLNSDAWIGAIDRVNDIKNTIDLGNESAESVVKLRQELAEILALPTLGKSMVENMTQGVVGLGDALDNAGKMGGADMYGSSQIIKDLMVWQNQLPGERKQIIKKNPKNNKWEMSVVINGNSYTAEQLNNLKKGDSSLVATVSDQSSNFDSYTGSLKIENKENGELEFKEGMFSGKGKRIDKETGEEVSYNVVDKAFAIKEASEQIDASISVMTADEKAIFWNNRLAKKDSKNQIVGKSMSAEDFDDPENQKEFKTAYTDKWFDSQVGKVVETSRVKIKEPAKPTTREEKAATGKKNYDAAVKLIDSSEDDLNFGETGYNHASQYEKILRFAGRTGLSIKVSQILDKDDKINSIVFTSLDDKSEIVLPKGASDKQVRDAIKASSRGGRANYKQSSAKELTAKELRAKYTKQQ